MVPWSNQEIRRQIRNLYNVTTMPWLTIVRNDDKGTVVSTNGMQDLFQCGYFALAEWRSMYKERLAEAREAKRKLDAKGSRPASPREQLLLQEKLREQQRLQEAFPSLSQHELEELGDQAQEGSPTSEEQEAEPDDEF